jgi:hypothetical protein
MESHKAIRRSQKLPKFLIGAIEDWKDETISTGRLFEIFRVNYFEAYPKLQKEQGSAGSWPLDLPTEKIAEILFSCRNNLLGASGSPAKEDE